MWSFPTRTRPASSIFRRSAEGVAVFDQRPDGSVESWPRVSVSCDYLSAIRFGDVIDIEAGVLKVGRTSVTYQFRFALDGKPVATGRVVAVRCRLGEEGRPQAVLVPEEIIARLSGYAFPEDRAADATAKRTVQKGELQHAAIAFAR